MMTQAQVLVQMEESFGRMKEEDKTRTLFNDGEKDWTPTLMLEEVRGDTERGQKYAKNWAQNQEDIAMLTLLDGILGGAGMTCGDPNCQNCHGEVRPFNQG